ncbi:MAG: peptidase [Gammaproteobacteria bacterium]|nr:peptidase [Gammaproteobacteria bacterium]
MDNGKYAVLPDTGKWHLLFFCCALLNLVTGCNGGGGEDPADPPIWTAGVYEDEARFRNFCAAPRFGTDIYGDAYPDKQGSILLENHWLRSWSNNTYLWYSELPDYNPELFSLPVDYFELLKADASKDRFHFVRDTAEANQFYQSGVAVGYGIDWEIVHSYPPREVRIRYIEAGSPAAEASLSLARGAEIIAIDGVDVEYGDDGYTINAGLFPSSDGESHVFTIRDSGSITNRDVSLQASAVTANPVPLVEIFNSDVGYIFFNDHNYVSEDKLHSAIQHLADNSVSELILDLRYNGGGLLYIANQISYMIAGPAATDDKIFEEIRFNDKHTQVNPVTGNMLSPRPFYSTVSPDSDDYVIDSTLPSLDLTRVFILSTDSTCSASEAIINGLRGIDVEVILIGGTTCGKPYGFYATDNCGTTYYTIQFEGVNDKGEGGYSDGFSPSNAFGAVGEPITGCSVADDLSYALGDEQEPLLAGALGYISTSTCPASPRLRSSKSSVVSDPGLALTIPEHLNQKIYLNRFKD